MSFATRQKPGGPVEISIGVLLEIARDSCGVEGGHHTGLTGSAWVLALQVFYGSLDPTKAVVFRCDLGPW
jgi:hypothetical protein